MDGEALGAADEFNMWAGMGQQPEHGMTEIDLKTGLPKKKLPLKEAPDYRKWDQIAKRVTQHEGDSDDDDQIAEYSWVEMPHADIRVRIPVWVKTKSKMCKVVIKLNWLTVYAPPTEAVVGYYKDDEPPKEPLLDFQLYGAVNVDECDWCIEDDGAVRCIILTLVRAPVYKWPTLHRVNGLKSEAERAVRRKEEREQFEREQKEAEKAGLQNQELTQFAKMAGPQKPPTFGPAPRPKRRPHRPKDEHGNPLPPVGRPPGTYERGRIIVTAPDYTDSDSD